MGARAVVGTVVVLGVLVGGAAVADGVVRERTEDELAANLQTQIPGLDAEPEVTIGGFPFLTQVLAGELDEVHATAPSLTVEGIPLEDVVVDLAGVSTDQPTQVRDATMTASVSLASMTEVLAVPVDLAIDGERLVASGDILGLPLEAALAPRADGRAIAVDVETINLGGVEVAVEDLPGALADQLTGLTVPVDGLPEGIELTEVTVTTEGVDLTAAGSDVVLDAAALG